MLQIWFEGVTRILYTVEVIHSRIYWLLRKCMNQLHNIVGDLYCT